MAYVGGGVGAEISLWENNRGQTETLERGWGW